MQRVTITIDDDLLAIVDSMVTDRGYTSRSEAFRDLVRESRTRDPATDTSDKCVATLTYVYDHSTRNLAQRITQTHLDRHDLVVATLRVHLDHESLLESTVLRGKTLEVTAFADSLTGQRGVRYAHLHTIPVTIERAQHHHGDETMLHDHLHT